MLKIIYNTCNYAIKHSLFILKCSLENSNEAPRFFIYRIFDNDTERVNVFTSEYMCSNFAKLMQIKRKFHITV